MTPSAIGTFRHLVQVQGPGAAVPDGDGGYVYTFADLVPGTWYCSIEPATARSLERVAAGTVIATSSHILTGRWRGDLTVASRVIFDGRVFQLTGVANPEERRIRTICTAVELIGAPLVADYAWTQPGWISETPAFVQEGTF